MLWLGFLTMTLSPLYIKLIIFRVYNAASEVSQSQHTSLLLIYQNQVYRIYWSSFLSRFNLSSKTFSVLVTTYGENQECNSLWAYFLLYIIQYPNPKIFKLISILKRNSTRSKTNWPWHSIVSIENDHIDVQTFFI